MILIYLFLSLRTPDFEGDPFEKLLEVMVQLGPPGVRTRRLTPQEQVIEQMHKQLKSFALLQTELRDGILHRVTPFAKTDPEVSALDALFFQL